MKVYLGKFVPLDPNAFLGHMSSVVYLGGCNWRCPYCNVPSILDEADCELVFTGDIFAEIIHARDFIDAVVFNGGEPTIQSKPLISLCELVRGEGMSVKVQTNGSRPEVVKELLVRELVDKLSIDVKTLFDLYPAITGSEGEGSDVLNTISVAKEFDVDWEIVIPVIKGVNEKIVPKMIKEVQPKLTVLRAFEKKGILDPGFGGDELSHSEIVELAKNCPGKVHVFTKLYGEEVV